MTALSRSLFKYLFLFGFLLLTKEALGQGSYEAIRLRIDSFADAGLPRSAAGEVDKLEMLARQEKNIPWQIKAVIYRMTFQSYIEEDALQEIISRLRTNIMEAGYPVKPVLQSLLGDMYWKYYQQNRYQFSQRSRLLKPDTDFRQWDLQTIITETGNLYRLSLADAVREQATPVNTLNGVLEGDTTTRYLRPTLYDLLLHRALDFFLSDEPAITKPRIPFTLNDPRLFADSRTFAELQISTADTSSTWYQGIRNLQQASAFHLQAGHEEAVADIDLKRLKFLFEKSNVTHKDSLYLSALKRIAADFAQQPISSEALLTLGQYFSGKDSLVTAYDYYQRALKAFPKSVGGQNAEIEIRKILQKNVSATVESIYAPGRSILALVGYRNISSAKVLIYHLSQAQYTNYLEGYSSGAVGSYAEFRLGILKKLKPVQQQNLEWKNPGDYRSHSAEFKIDSLPPGNYVILIQGDGSGDEKMEGLASFRVSGMAYLMRVNPDDNTEVVVTDRETGEPVSGVKLLLTGQRYIYKNGTSHTEDLTETGNTDINGTYIVKKVTSGNISIKLIAVGDTLSDGGKYISGAIDDSDDDEPDDKTILFTDRQIYRPGQTIYFKGLQIQTFKGKSKIMPGKELKVQFMDVNYKEVSSMQLKTNDYGTVSGSFIIPQSMLDGQVQLKTENGDISIRVEEYKRPTFQVEFSPVKGSFHLNDTVQLRGKVIAYSGYGLSKARVAFHITRNVHFDYRYIADMYRRRNYYNYRSAEIKTDTVVTDDQGNYTIKFQAAPDENQTYPLVNYQYSIKADVMDASGETRSGNTSVVVGYNDISFEAYLPEQFFAKDSLKTVLKVNNLNGQPQKANVKVEVYALKSPAHPYKARLWDRPDQYLLGRDEFASELPEYPYHDENQPSAWQRGKKIVDITLAEDVEKPCMVDLNALRKEKSGMYQVIISAKNEKGDTTSNTKYIDLVADSPSPALIRDWVIPVQNYVKPGMSAEFLVGLGQKINVLVERYDGSKLISSRWEMIEGGQRRFRFPVSAKDKDVAVQFLAFYQGRVYSSMQNIDIADPDKALKFKLLSFRNKLQPGEKEQWSLQVTGMDNERRSAEAVAALYDASLDALATPQNWQGLLDNPDRYRGDYFLWETSNFISGVKSDQVQQPGNDFSLLIRNYERLNLFGYDYYGGYNNAYRQYLQRVRQHVVRMDEDKELKDLYAKNAARVKKGYVITGKVLGSDDSQPVPGARVSIKGTNIGTLTDGYGSFKLKVPVNGSIIISAVGYQTQTILVTNAQDRVFKLKATESALREVVVVGYGVQTKKELTGSVATVRIRGTSSIYGSRSGYFDFEGNAAGLEITPVAEKSIRDTSLFIPKASKQITIRKNFNETAFFYPQLHTDSDGKILIGFTIPEALTKWRFKAFAHTRDLAWGYKEDEVVTQKQLSVSANMPRFMREGDTITVSARLANLTDHKLRGTVMIQLFDGLNMHPVQLLTDPVQAKQKIELAAQTNKAVSFRMVIPSNLDALTYRLTADAGNYSDGEENTLPVLPNRMLVTESMPMMVRAGQDRTFNFDKLLNNNSTTLRNKSLTLEYTQNPAWYAVQAIPYMMEFPYECSEQVFGRYYANSLATNLLNHIPVIKQVFDQWKSTNSTELLSSLENNQELKYTLLEETPWLRNAVNETEQKKNIALLFDLNKMSSEMQANLDKLQQRQLPDGGFTWFAGDHADRYITQHVVAGIGQLYHLHIADDSNAQLRSIAGEALGYLDNKLIEDDNYAKLHPKNYESRSIWYTEIHAWYARSYYPGHKMSDRLKKVFDNYLQRAERQWITQNIYEQGMIALTLLRNNHPQVAGAIVRSLKETAQRSDDMGMYWGKNLQGYFWYQAPIETQSLMIELFTEASGNDKDIDEMKIWLLRNKQTSDWKTTKATAAACYALLMKQDGWLSPDNTSDIKLADQELSILKPDIKADAGTGYIKTSWAGAQVDRSMGKVVIKNNGKSISWGALHWQYQEQLDKITPSKTDIQLERKYFILKQTDSGPAVVPVDAQHQPKTGDVLKVIVHLKAGRDFEYVQLKDMRPAGTEPISVLSQYKYQDGLWYYEVTKDVATNFFISYLNKGSYVFEYQLRVVQPGNFSTGITTIQCMYAPEFNAHSEGQRIIFK